MQEPISTFIVRLLRGVSSGDMDGNEAIVQLVEREQDIVGISEYEGAWSDIQHFVDDSDIRRKEPSYGRKQRDDMLALAERIEAGTYRPRTIRPPA